LIHSQIFQSFFYLKLANYFSYCCKININKILWKIKK
jgi:hypothetical protein